ncbi:MAG: hypothetical protein QOF63_1619 [Thermoanaerobaculia bacterium]|jgi:hypothetical protein|nr:hypothetical protein [Thermoanaerobaculia bacterium]
MSRHSVVISFVTAAFCATIAAAQSTNCKGLPPLQDSQSGYQKRGDRCEGLYVANVGAHSLTAMSFSLGKIRYDLNPLVNLQVSAPGQKEPVNVRAVAIPPKTYYRMDAGLAAGTTMVWPVRDVLLRENLSDSRIGIFGWKGAENAKTLVPLRVVPQDKAVTPAPPFLTIEASFDAQVVKWRWAPAQKDGCQAFGPWQNAIEHPVTASWPIAIKLAALPPGVHCLETAAQSGGSTTWETLKLRLEIPSL